jgi:hypothetical protein
MFTVLDLSSRTSEGECAGRTQRSCDRLGRCTADVPQSKVGTVAVGVGWCHEGPTSRQRGGRSFAVVRKTLVSALRKTLLANERC